MTVLATIEPACAGSGLIVMGIAPHDGGSALLLGTGPGFWPVFSRSPEQADGQPDPVDRWSKRVIGGLARDTGATCCFPSDGPPYPPFIDWALKSGRAFSSPTGMLVHDTVGLMISYRGALLFARPLAVPAPAPASPCASCADQPCTTACPVAALSAVRPYDVLACHAHLDHPAGAGCMSLGCAARRACPLSAGAGRDPSQSALHMKAFHPT